VSVCAFGAASVDTDDGAAAMRSSWSRFRARPQGRRERYAAARQVETAGQVLARVGLRAPYAEKAPQARGEERVGRGAAQKLQQHDP